MISKIKTFFQDQVLSPDSEGQPSASLKSIHKASAALMVEVMLSDGRLSRQVNLHFSADEKFELIKHMWHIAFIDNELDKYEESLIRQVADLIYLPHSQFIKAKSLARNTVE